MAAMGDADILQSLREQVLDESESLAGLLRKCLALGAVTGSDELREWANNELKGYAEDSPLPSYRRLSAPLFVDTMSGPNYVRNQQISRIQIPSDLRKHVPETLDFRQSIDEIAQMAEADESTHKMGYGIFSVVAAQWSAQLPMFQDVTALYYQVSPSALVGMVGTIRTTLVEIVIDMAKDVPLNSLPTRAKVDSVVQVHVGTNNSYEVNVGGNNSGVIGQGTGFTQTQNASVPAELVALIGQMRSALPEVADDDQRADVAQAIDDFEESVSEDDPKPEKVKRRWRALERFGTAVTSAVLTEAVKDAAPLIAENFHVLF